MTGAVGVLHEGPRYSTRRATQNMLIKLRPMARMLVVSAAAGCAAAPPLGQQNWLDFLQPGATTRTVVTDLLGAPDAAFEGGRILTYWIASDAGGYFKPRR